MLNETQIEKLKSNWGTRAQALACHAEVRFYDPCSAWQCYVLAINPHDEQEIMCIISTNPKEAPEVTYWTLDDLFSLFNNEGESVKLDLEYRARQAAEIFKKLNELTIYETRRN